VELQRLGHEGHHVRLRDRLAIAYRQRVISVRPADQRFVNKQVTRHLANGSKDPRIQDAATLKLLRNHPLTWERKGTGILCFRGYHTPPKKKSVSCGRMSV
jgi:hypothetical protein